MERNVINSDNSNNSGFTISKIPVQGKTIKLRTSWTLEARGDLKMAGMETLNPKCKKCGKKLSYFFENTKEIETFEKCGMCSDCWKTYKENMEAWKKLSK